MTRITNTADPLKILLVEDSKGDALLIENALDQAMESQHSIAKAKNIREALALLAQDNFDVALLDRSLPDAEGFDGLHSLQNLAPELPIVFLTAYQDEQTSFDAIIQGAQDYLFKDKLDGHVIQRAIQYAVLRKQFEGVLVTRANFDVLTGLANRMLFESRLEMALAKMQRQEGNLAVLFLDLNRFKQVNDTLGHAGGDALLKEVGQRLKKSLRPYDTAARFGGDEFAVLLESLPKPHHAEVVAEKIIRLIDAPFLIYGNEIHIGISIGIADTAKPLSATTLMQRADRAMYAAKSNPESTWRLYEAEESSPLRTASR